MICVRKKRGNREYLFLGLTAAARREQQILQLARLLPSWRHQVAPALMPGIQSEDLIGVGLVALIRALDRYDPSRGASVRTWVALKVKGEMREYLEKESAWLSRVLPESERPLSKLRGLQLAEWLACLPPEWAAIVRARCEGHEWQAIARACGRQPTAVYATWERAIRRLRRQWQGTPVPQRPRAACCRKGHERNHGNAVIRKDGSYFCRMCDRERHRNAKRARTGDRTAGAAGAG